MKIISATGFVFLTFITSSVFSQKQLSFDLHSMVKKNEIQVIKRELSLIDEKSHAGIRLSKDFGEGIAWLKDVEFSKGIIEFDVRGENVKQHSFVGIAFHGINDSTFDAIYLRPFQFLEQEEVLKNRAIQYISLPAYPWRTLREKFPGKYEHGIDPSPDPNSWVRFRLVVNDESVITYINGSTTPSLIIQKLTQVKKGFIGFYVADTSGGDFSNLTITKEN